VIHNGGLKWSGVKLVE